MARKSKRFKAMMENHPGEEAVQLNQAVDLLKDFAGTKFDQAVEVHMRLGVDAKQADQIIRGSIVLPHGIGKVQRVVVFAKDALAEAATNAGADEVGQEELAKKIVDGWTEFDVCIATPDMMRHVGKLGKILGPQGKMPSPKAGTVTMDVTNAVSEFKAGKIEFRNDAGANIAAPMGKRSFSGEQLRENVQAFIDHVQTLKPAAAKGAFVLRGALSATQSPGIPLKV